MARDRAEGMTDKERLLTEISTHLGPFTKFFSPSNPPGQYDYVYWWSEPEVGDLVQAQSSGVHPWTWGYVEALPTEAYGTWVIRELDGERLCNISNDRMYALRGIPQRRLLYGQQRKFYIKLQKAFAQVDSWQARFRDLTFEDRHSKVARVSVRPHGMVKPRNAPQDVRHTFEVPFTSRTTIKSLVERIEAVTPDWRALYPNPDPLTHDFGPVP